MARAYAYGGFVAAFLPIRDRETAQAAARSSAWAAGYLALLYGAIGLGRGLALGLAGAAVIGGYNLTLATGAAALAWLAWRRHPRWVAAVILAWVSARFAGSIVNAGLTGRIDGLLLPALATLYALAGVRGAWALDRYRAAPADAFD